MKKRIVAVKTFDKLIIDPDFCPHENTRWQTIGGYFTTDGEVDDDVRDICTCLDCGEMVNPPAYEMNDKEYWENEKRRTELYHRALDEIEAEKGSCWYADYYHDVRARHRELCDKAGVIIFEPLKVEYDGMWDGQQTASGHFIGSQDDWDTRY